MGCQFQSVSDLITLLHNHFKNEILVWSSDYRAKVNPHRCSTLITPFIGTMCGGVETALDWRLPHFSQVCVCVHNYLSVCRLCYLIAIITLGLYTFSYFYNRCQFDQCQNLSIILTAVKQQQPHMDCRVWWGCSDYSGWGCTWGAFSCPKLCYPALKQVLEM